MACPPCHDASRRAINAIPAHAPSRARAIIPQPARGDIGAHGSLSGFAPPQADLVRNAHSGRGCPRDRATMINTKLETSFD
jgi:hypothetical protein